MNTILLRTITVICDIRGYKTFKYLSPYQSKQWGDISRQVQLQCFRYFLTHLKVVQNCSFYKNNKNNTQGLLFTSFKQMTFVLSELIERHNVVLVTQRNHSQWDSLYVPNGLRSIHRNQPFKVITALTASRSSKTETKGKIASQVELAAYSYHTIKLIWYWENNTKKYSPGAYYLWSV